MKTKRFRARDLKHADGQAKKIIKDALLIREHTEKRIKNVGENSWEVEWEEKNFIIKKGL